MRVIKFVLIIIINYFFIQFVYANDYKYSDKQYESQADYYKICNNINSLGSKATLTLASYFETQWSDSSSFKAFAENYNIWVEHQEWISQGNGANFSISDLNYVYLPSDWKAVDIKTLIWSLGFDATNDKETQKRIVAKVLEWLKLRSTLRENNQSFQDQIRGEIQGTFQTYNYKNEPGSLSNAQRLFLPLVDTWLEADFFITRAFALVNNIECSNMALCNLNRDHVLSTLFRTLKPYRDRIQDVLDAFQSENTFEGDRHKRLVIYKGIADRLSNVTNLDEAAEGILLEDIHSYVEAQEALSGTHISAFYHLLHLIEVKRSMDLAADKSDLVVSDAYLDNLASREKFVGIVKSEIKKSLQFFEQEFSNTQKNIVRGN